MADKEYTSSSATDETLSLDNNGDYQNILSSKRKYPRRRMEKKVGVLFDGTFLICNSKEVGEGGISFESDYVLTERRHIVITFQVPLGEFVSVRGEVRSTQKLDGQMLYGISFRNLDFAVKRQIRTYVSNWTGF